MGSFAFTTIAGFKVEGTKNYFHEWFFKKGDRKILMRNRSARYELEAGEEDEIEPFYVYEISAQRLKRRLELGGFNLSAAEKEFYECIHHRIAAVAEFDDSKDFNYRQHTAAFKSADFRDWLTKLKFIIERKLNRAYDYYTNEPQSDPILDILLNVPFYQHLSDDWSLRQFESINWPAKNVESLARCILEVVPQNASCELDLTELIDGGYTDSFDDLIEFESESTRSLQIFDTAIGDVRKLMLLDPGNEVLARLLFANTITAMETYLGDTLRKQVARRETLLRRFVETNPELKREKISLSQIFEQREKILGQVMEMLDKTSFHNIDLVKNIYCSVFSVNLDGLPFDAIQQAVEKRHDIIHRNGSDKQGKMRTVTMAEVESLITTISVALQGIDLQVKDGLLEDIEKEQDDLDSQ